MAPNKLKLSEFLHTLDFQSARKSSEYVGTRIDNPSMILEEGIPIWTKITDMDDIRESFKIFEERVCIHGFAARYSPQFWLAHAALTAIYQVLCGYLMSHFDPDIQRESDELLFHLWVELISAGPGSTHLEMMDVIMKNSHFPLWKYMEQLHDDNLKLLVTTLKTDFVYEEDVPVDHYATLMETHIDKIFRSILSLQQYEEAQRELLDLQLYYLSKMNHVPPHIGPRLSHLCFLICSRYDQENPYVGMDDWVLTRHHLKGIKDVITNPTFTVASEAQYRAPITLEKIFQAAVIDKMLEIMFKDFMTLILTFCNYGNSRKCKRLFLAYQAGLFEQMDFKKGFESCPIWLFDQCIKALTQLADIHGMETHVEQFVIHVEHACLLNFINLSTAQISAWHNLLVNYVVSGRRLFVCETKALLDSPVLEQNKVFDWKNKMQEAKMLVDIIADLPKTFIQNDETFSLTDTVQSYADFLEHLLHQIKEAGQEGRVRDNIHRCVIKCSEKDPPFKAQITLTCLNSGIPDFQDLNFIKEILFSIEKLLKDNTCPSSDGKLSVALVHILTACLTTFRNKGYIAVDFNSLLMSISVICVSADTYQDEDDGDHVDWSHDTGDLVTESHDMYTRLYHSVIIPFVGLHIDNGSARAISSLVPQVVLVIQEAIEQGTSFNRGIDFLQVLGNSCIQIVSDHVTIILELFIDWECFQLNALLVQLYPGEPGPFISRLQDLFDRLPDIYVEYRHMVTQLLSLMSQNQTQLFEQSHISQLLTMYPDETEETQEDILDIVRNVAQGLPSLVIPHYCDLTDDTKFSPLSLRGRAPILGSISHSNEDFVKKTVDYLMKHISSKDSAVSLAAMETLVPLVKDNPVYVHKQKAKFRTLWRSSDCTQVKKLCVTLLPDIQHLALTGTKQVLKGAQSVTKDPKKAFTPIPKATVPKPVKQPTVKPISMAKTATTKTLTTRALKHDKDVKKEGKGDAGITDVESKDVNPESTEKLGKYFAVEKMKEQISDKKQVKYKEKVVNHSGAVKEKQEIADIQVKLYDKEKHGLYKSNTKLLSEVEVESSRNKTNDGAVNYTVIADDNSDSRTENEDKVEPKQVHDIDKSSSSLTSLVEAIRPPIHLLGMDKQKLKKLGDSLKNAGYETCISDYGTMSGCMDDNINYIGNAKVVIFCLNANMGESSQKIAKEISSTIDTKVPVIFLKLQDMPWPPTGALHFALTNRPYIRFYLKPGEIAKQLGADWPQHKFGQLLMELSYYGLLPDNRLVTKEFSNWWKHPVSCPPLQSDVDVGDKSQGRIYSTADIFISYHWGKQIQAESLYDYLTNMGFHCWMGAHQMGGSESLYNKISQGLQGCRVVIACVNNVYMQAENCKQEVIVALRLYRPIIPVVMGNVKWPLSGEVGQKLMKFGHVKPEMAAGGSIDIHSNELLKLLEKLNQYVPGIIHEKLRPEKFNIKKSESQGKSDKCNTTELDTKTIETKTPKQSSANSVEIIETKHSDGETIKMNETEQKNIEAIEINKTKEFGENLRKQMKIHPQSSAVLAKSTSMYELETENRNYQGERNLGYSKTDDDLIMRKRRIPDGMLVDEMGNTVKSVRSKSCVIL